MLSEKRMDFLAIIIVLVASSLIFSFLAEERDFWNHRRLIEGRGGEGMF